jgi:hypothetical protein
MAAESIRSGGLEYDAAWVRCTAHASFKPDEALVLIDAQDVAEPLDFFVDSSLVHPAELPRDHAVNAEVKVIVLGRQDGSALIEVLGEPLSFGPKFAVSTDLMTEGPVPAA